MQRDGVLHTHAELTETGAKGVRHGVRLASLVTVQKVVTNAERFGNL